VLVGFDYLSEAAEIMLNFLNFYRYFWKSRYALALACLSGESNAFQARQQYAYYRLGMYRTALSEEVIIDDWRSLFAAIISLAACGEKDKALQYLRDKNVMKMLEPHRMNFVNGLLAFLPDAAFRLLPTDAPLGLQLALSLAFADKAKVAADLAALEREPRLAERDPDLYLLRNNALPGPPLVQLQGLNAYFGTYGLLPVVLQNPDLPPSAMNLRAAGDMPCVDGPLVSILMTAYESAVRIVPAIQSLLTQTYQNLEVLVIDDASSDRTGDVVQALAKLDVRVRYLKLPVNVGTFVAKTIGFHLAQGDFVTCHDSDDWAHPEKIALQMKPLLSDSKVIFTASNMVRVRDDGYFYARQIYPLTRLNSSSLLFRKHIVFSRCGLWDLVRTGADSEFLARLKIVFGPKAMRRINRPLSFCAHRPDSLMTSATSGYNDHGIAPDRLTYWESFTHWHIHELRQGRLPKLPPLSTSLSHRPFEVPESIKVPLEDIEQCLSILKNFHAHY
jgi:hypothetical protein